MGSQAGFAKLLRDVAARVVPHWEPQPFERNPGKDWGALEFLLPPDATHGAFRPSVAFQTGSYGAPDFEVMLQLRYASPWSVPIYARLVDGGATSDFYEVDASRHFPIDGAVSDWLAAHLRRIERAVQPPFDVLVGQLARVEPLAAQLPALYATWRDSRSATLDDFASWLRATQPAPPTALELHRKFPRPEVALADARQADFVAYITRACALTWTPAVDWIVRFFFAGQNVTEEDGEILRRCVACKKKDRARKKSDAKKPVFVDYVCGECMPNDGM